MGEPPSVWLGKACEVLGCPVGSVSLRVMMREPVVGRFEPIDVHLLQGFGGLGVKRLATRVRDALVDHLLRQRVLEDVERFLDARPGVKELLSRELAQMRLRSEEHTSELQSLAYLVCRLLLEKKKNEHV